MTSDFMKNMKKVKIVIGCVAEFKQNIQYKVPYLTFHTFDFMNYIHYVSIHIKF